VAALGVVFVFSRLPGTLRLVLRLAIIGGVIALLAGAYFGWLRRESQQSHDALAGPGALIDDAKAAVSKMNARIQAEQAELKETEQAK
jgi:ABC-type transport system involved in cytochrome bd biosynthesis fused ATPase/permease subunit